MNDSPRLTDGSPDGDLGQTLIHVARRLVDGGTTPDPRAVVEAAARALPGATACGLTLVRPDRPVATLASTGAGPAALDELQVRAQEGPLVERHTPGGTTRVDDLWNDARWPRLAREARAVGATRSLLVLRLALAERDEVALSAHADEAGAFGDDHRATLELLAPAAGLAVESVLRAEDVTNLTSALETSRQIGVAVGIVMATRHLLADEAFGLLRQASMDLNRKLHDIAEEVELTGLVPGTGGAAQRHDAGRRSTARG